MQISMERIDVKYFPNWVDPGINKKRPVFHSCISDDNEQDACD